MLLTNEQLRELVAGRAIGDQAPYAGGSEAQIESLLRRAVELLGLKCGLDVAADFEHYGSGYATYVHVFCQKNRRRSQTVRDGTTWIDGLAVYLCRLAPFAVYGRETRTQSNGGGSSSFIRSSDVYTLPEGDWQEEITALRRTLEHRGFIFPPREDLIEPLPLKLKIPTVFDQKDVFDAIFYWED